MRNKNLTEQRISNCFYTYRFVVYIDLEIMEERWRNKYTLYVYECLRMSAINRHASIIKGCIAKVLLVRRIDREASPMLISVIRKNRRKGRKNVQSG